MSLCPLLVLLCLVNMYVSLGWGHAQSVKCWLFKPEDLNSVPRTKVKKPGRLMDPYSRCWGWGNGQRQAMSYFLESQKASVAESESYRPVGNPVFVHTTQKGGH